MSEAPAPVQAAAERERDGRAGGAAVSETAERAGEVAERAGEVMERAGEVADRAGDLATEAAETVEHHARRYRVFAVGYDVMRRFGEIDGRSRVAAITLDVFIALVPITILLTAFIQPTTHTRGYGDLLVRAFSLHGGTAELVRHAFAAGTQSRQAASIAAVLGFVIAGFDLTNALQTTYDRAWRCESMTGVRAGARGLLWLGLAAVFHVALTFVGAFADRLAWGEAIMIGLATVPASIVFWLITPGLLLTRSMHWRALLPGAIVCSVGLLVLQTSSSLFLPSTIAQYYRMFGELGIAIALLFWIWLAALLWVLGAVTSAVLWERRTGTCASDLEIRERLAARAARRRAERRAARRGRRTGGAGEGTGDRPDRARTAA